MTAAERWFSTPRWVLLPVLATLVCGLATGCPRPSAEQPALLPAADDARPLSSEEPQPLSAEPDAQIAIHQKAEGDTSPAPEQLAQAAVARKKAVRTGTPPAEPAADAYGEEHPKVDPILQNGPIFEGWEKPALAIVISGEQDGYLEPCGCAGLENQKGGLLRRATMLREREKAGWTLLPIDLGGLVRRYGPQAEIQYQTSADALRLMKYGAVGYGLHDLRLPAGVLAAATENESGENDLFTSANVGVMGFDAGFTLPFRIIEKGGIKVALISVLGETFRKQLNAQDIASSPVLETLKGVIARVKNECELIVLLSDSTPEESLALAKRFEEIGVVVTAGGAEEPPAEPTNIPETGGLLIDVGHKGMYCGVIGLYKKPERRLRYQRVPLDTRFADDPLIKQCLVKYQETLQLAGFENLGAKPVTHSRTKPNDEARGHFVGAARCGQCHTKAFAKWQTTHHAHATETLAKLKPSRQFDPECISCHSTGWNPQEYVPYATGFASIETTPHLVGNGCENCHGPGQAHSDAETKGAKRDLSRRNDLRAAMRLTKATVEQNVCIQCHDLDNSPKFHGNFERYWSKVEHHGKD